MMAGGVMQGSHIQPPLMHVLTHGLIHGGLRGQPYRGDILFPPLSDAVYLLYPVLKQMAESERHAYL